MRKSAIGSIAKVLGLLLALSSCGFTPVYAPGSQTAVALSDISVSAPTNQLSYLFVRAMEERLGRPANPSKTLRYQIKVEPEGVENESERRRFVGVVTYELISRDTKAKIVGGAVDSFTGYSSSDGLFASARQDALERLMIILADQVQRDLIVKLSRQ